MPRRPDRPLTPADLPKHCLHRPTGIGRIRWRGKTHYTGKWTRRRGVWKPTKGAEAAYNAICAQLLAHGGILPEPTEAAEAEDAGILVLELVDAYLSYVENVRHAGREGTLGRIRSTMAVLLEVAGEVPVRDFGRRELIGCRDAMVAGKAKRRRKRDDPDAEPQWDRKPWSRSTVNAAISQIKRMFAWGAERELVPDATVAALERLRNLQRGETSAREDRTIEAVPEAEVEAILPFLTSPVRAMVRLQALTGMRPGEVCGMRAVDLDTSGPVWLYRPQRHKTAHHGKSRTIPLGPRCQEVLAPFLRGRPVSAFLFSPAEAEAERRANRPAPKAPPSKSRTMKRKRSPKRAPRDRYDTGSYRGSIEWGCKAAGIDPIAPNRIRHLAATKVRSEFGADAAQALLGHSSLSMTERYAKVDASRLVEVAAKVG